MSITFNQEIMNQFGMTYSQTLDSNDRDDDNSITTTVTRVSYPSEPYFIFFTDTFTNDGVGKCDFMVFPYTTAFLASFFEDEQELFKLSEDEYSRLEGRTLHFGVKYVN